jgi:hypothetical protein
MSKGNMKVMVANGERVPCLGVYRAMVFTISSEGFTTDFFALPLAGYDSVLGTQWLASLGPILWDFGDMSFWHHDHQVYWQGATGPASPSLQVCEGNNLMDALLDAFAAIFTKPTSLPPPRSRDHSINLVPSLAPVAIRPYRYPIAHKDKLEHQCATMLEQGLIWRSSSTFSSLVLLVKKADGS